MCNIFDVANYILSKTGNITAMKLEKLCYYSQVWVLVWSEKPLFNNRIEAWGKGPVSPELYEWHKGQLIVTSDDKLKSKCENNITKVEEDIVLEYGKFTAQELSDLTHAESPWLEANSLCSLSSNCQAEITQAAMHEFYSSLPEKNV